MKYLLGLALVVGIAAGALFGLTNPQPVEADYYLVDCGDGDHFRWGGNIGRVDVTHGNLSDLWQTEIAQGATIWGVSTVGADFYFVMDPTSPHGWGKKTRYDTDHIAHTTSIANANTCNLDSVQSWFNTRFSFADCDDCPDNTFDLQTVAGHEMGHWLVLDDYPWWDFFADGSCLMADWHGRDYTLCDDDVNGIIFIYGEN